MGVPPRTDDNDNYTDNVDISPPQYEAEESTRPASETMSLSAMSLSETAKATGDGRIDINMNGRMVRAMSKIYPQYSRPIKEAPPPKYVEAMASAWAIPMNIVIQVVGSRGDVQPFVALGNELQRHGHRVRIATHGVFDSFVRSSGLEFYSIGGDPTELMAYMVKNPGLIPNMQSLRQGEIQRKREMIAEMLEGCWKSCIAPDAVSDAPFVADAIIANPPSFAHVHCAQALGVPVHLMFTMPWSSTRAFPHPLANIGESKMPAEMANFLSYGVVEWMTWRGLGDIINTWRRSIGLEDLAESVGPFLQDILKVPFTYCWSPALVPKPFDWPGHIDVCGFFFRDPPEYSPPKELTDWLQAGTRPIYIGFGSIVIENPEKLTQTILEAVDTSGVRAIVSRGWSKLGGPANTDRVFYLDDCPHEWLFQQVSAVIHHGGAGTTACGLLNASPTFIVPFFGDQPFWGSMVAVAGAGPHPIPQRQLNSKNLTQAIEFLLRPETAEAAEVMASRMRSENGVKAAVQSFHRRLPADLIRCDLLPRSPAVWSVTSGKAEIRISKLASEILMEYGELERKALKPYHSNIIDTDNKRWDPITGTSSALLGASSNLVQHTAGIFTSPYDVYRKERKAADRNGSKDIEHKTKLAGSMTTASATSVGKFVGGYTKSVLVDVPLALTEGLQAIPTMYGEEKKDLGKVTDWKSGFVVAGKTFAYGFTGISDVVTKPIEGAKTGGTLGAIKGVGIGLSNMSTKMFAGSVGTLAFSGQGICKSLHTATHREARKDVRAARLAEGAYLLSRLAGDDNDNVARSVVDKFRAAKARQG